MRTKHFVILDALTILWCPGGCSKNAKFAKQFHFGYKHNGFKPKNKIKLFDRLASGPDVRWNGMFQLSKICVDMKLNSKIRKN